MGKRHFLAYIATKREEAKVMYFSRLDILWNLFSEPPTARALIKGEKGYENLSGLAHFYETVQGVLVLVEMTNLPLPKLCESGIYAMHIHDMAGHYNPAGCMHPYHAGDMPPLFSTDGYALTIFVTDRFKISDIIGKMVVVHERRDDFSTQPSGDAGEKIAVGIIENMRKTA